MGKKEILRNIKYPGIFLTAFLSMWAFSSTYVDYMLSTFGWSFEFILITYLFIDFTISIIITAIIALIVLIYYVFILPNTHSDEFYTYIIFYINSFRELLSTKGYLTEKDFKKIQAQSDSPKIILKLLIKSFRNNYIFIKESINDKK